MAPFRIAVFPWIIPAGGFAHVYVVRSSRPIPSPGGSSEVLHVLKRVAVPDKPTLKEVRWEVDVMVRKIESQACGHLEILMGLPFAVETPSRA